MAALYSLEGGDGFMTISDEIERHLVRTPVPKVVEGPHRESLRHELLEELQRQSSKPQKEEINNATTTRTADRPK